MSTVPKSNLGFADLSKLKAKGKLVTEYNIDNIQKTNLKDIEELSVEAKKMLIDILEYGKRKECKVKANKLSLRQIHIMIDAICSRKAEVDQLLFENEYELVQEMVDLQLSRAKQDLVFQIIGTYRFNLAETVNDLRELALVVQKRENTKGKKRGRPPRVKEQNTD